MNHESATLHYRSLSQLVVDAQRPYRVVCEAVEALGIRPALTIDDRRYFASEVADLIRNYRPARRQRNERPETLCGK